MTDLLPHVALLPDRITDIVALPDGGYAIATGKHVYSVDDKLAVGAVIAETAGALRVLPDGRLVVQGSTMRIGTPGAITKIELGEYQRELFVTADGFVAQGSDRIVVESAATRTTIKLAKERYVHVTPWNGKLLLADKTGLQIVDASGAELARSSELYLTEKPIVIGEHFVVPGLSEIHVLDANAREVGKLASDTGVVIAFAGGVIQAPKPSYVDDDSGTRVRYLALEGTSLVERWAIEAPMARELRVIGDRIVLFLEDSAWIVEDGNVVAKLDDLGYVRDAAAFEDGIAILGTQLVWWRPSATSPLHYDGEINLARAVPRGLATAEGDVLQIWRTDVQGPAPVPLATDLPMNVPIVVDGTPMIIEGTNRFTLRARIHGNLHARSPAYKAWRHVTTRDEAVPLLERLIARTFDGPLPAIPSSGEWHEKLPQLAQLPLSQTVNLVGRGLFAMATLEPEVASFARSLRSAFLEELAVALGTRARLLLAAIRARKLKLEPPRAVPATYDYLGTFTTSGALTVADPCYLGKKSSGGFSLSLKVSALEGLWHVFIRDAPKTDGRNAELVVVHEDAFTVYASERAGNIGVDAGCAGVFDKACPKPNLDHGVDEGTVGGLGALAWSGYGDGMYPVFVGKHAGKVGKIRIAFIGDAPEVDHLIARPAASGNEKPYSAKDTFAVGDSIQHVKFGVGSVIRAADGKIDVRFDDETRTLVHAKK